ncbi:N-acetylglucosamine-6-phosphate deacetylase [Pseudalkalibacillus sp. A8]|uniref:N-acetylglucosamine-6-phosphate deacetylase n=1 Tax=Pseudalkalibacillus sp. A8 TaxID=3382641 RepID=UPI0038B464D4
MGMHQPFIITNLKIYNENTVCEKGYVKVVDGKIVEVGDLNTLSEHNEQYEVIIMPEDHCLIPGMIDVHIHGVAGADTMDATTEALETMAQTLPNEGTTSFLATTITQSHEAIEKALINVADYMGKTQTIGKSEILGIHLEGPFISDKRAGAQPLDHITEPDVNVFKKWQKLAQGNIKMVTLAPEEPGGLELISHLKETEVVPSIGHSNATYAEVDQAIESGATHVTHLFNGMRGLHHREPGVAGAALLRDELFVEIIADGIHIRPEMIRLAFQQKTKDKVILITDSIRAKCLKQGRYDLGGQEVNVSETKATLENGTLAGSILKMKDALRNFSSYTSCTIRDLIQITAVNPAKQLNVFEHKGSIATGKDADLVILNENLDVVMTFCRGKLAYKQGENDE